MRPIQCHGQDGFALWDEWSAKGSKYNAREMKAQWRSIGKGYNYGLGTLFHLANQADQHWREAYDAKLEADIEEAARSSINEAEAPKAKAEAQRLAIRAS